MPRLNLPRASCYSRTLTQGGMPSSRASFYSHTPKEVCPPHVSAATAAHPWRCALPYCVCWPQQLAQATSCPLSAPALPYYNTAATA